MGKAMAHHWGAHKARPAQLLRACHGQHNGSPLGRAQGAPGVTAPRLAMGKAMAHHWGAHKARPAQLLRTWPRAKQWIFQWLEGRERDVAITSLSQIIGKTNGMVRTPQASRQRQSHCRAKALCEAVQPCALHARTKGVQLSSNSPSALQKRARPQNRAVKGLR